MDSRRVLEFTNQLLSHPLFTGWTLDRLATGPVDDIVRSTVIISDNKGLVLKLELSISMEHHLLFERAELKSKGRLSYMTEVLRARPSICYCY